jgi:HTH-type transcriptional regulator/antitoxin HigA
LPRTYLDGAAIRLPDSSPLVALTLRYDRLDHFWFTLAHELAHVSLHLDRDDIEAFFDDLAAAGPQKAEQEADEFAAEALIPAGKWATAGLTTASPKQRVIDFAAQLMVSPAIPAGRLRFESRNYKLLQELVGTGEVRKLFK